MGAIAGGMALHGGPIPYTATFLIFSDYMRPPMRLAALMEQRVIYVFTHDSVALGEDGPTHQPVEQLLGLRAMPNLVVLRPADATETAEAWRVALERRSGPTALALTRQAVPIIDRTECAPAAGVQRGGYVLWEASADPAVILIGTGSEVAIALSAGRKLEQLGVPARVVLAPVVGAVRRAAGRLPRERPSADGRGPRYGRGGHDAWLGAVRRRQGCLGRR